MTSVSSVGGIPWTFDLHAELINSRTLQSVGTCAVPLLICVGVSVGPIANSAEFVCESVSLCISDRDFSVNRF